MAPASLLRRKTARDRRRKKITGIITSHNNTHNSVPIFYDNFHSNFFKILCRFCWYYFVQWYPASEKRIAIIGKENYRNKHITSHLQGFIIL